MKAIVRRLADQEWVGWPAEQVPVRGKVSWKGLFGDDPGSRADLVLGVARVRTGESLEAHRHPQAETYYTLSGRGVVTVDGEAIAVEPGTAIHIPGNARHQINNENAEDLLILYTFGVEDFAGIAYRF